MLAVLFSGLIACGKGKPFPGAALVNPLGTVTLMPASGKSAYRLTAEMQFRPEGLLLEGDAVRTGPNSRVDLQFPAGLVMRLGANSAVKLSRGKVLAGENFTDVLMELKNGRLMTRKKKLGAKSRVFIATPTIIASVRGTEFLVKADGDESAVLVQEGTVVVDEVPQFRGEELPPVPEAPDSPDAPEVPEVPDVPEISEEATEVTEGNKIEVETTDATDTSDATDASEEITDTGESTESEDTDSALDEDVAELDEDDREELDEMSDGLDYMDATGLEQIEAIQQSFEEAKQEIREAIDEQREANRELIETEKARMQDEFDAQKDAIRGDNVKQAQGEAQSELDRIKNMQ